MFRAELGLGERTLLRDAILKFYRAIVPCPAGLGRIDQSIHGVPDDELRAWLDMARTALAPRFDIHPEIVTHGIAVRVPTLEPLGLNEQEWAEQANAFELAEYFGFAMRVLKNAGFESNGVTQPWAFRGDERVYGRAALDAERAVHGHKIAHHFIHVDEWADRVPPRTVLADPQHGTGSVSIWTCTNDCRLGAAVCGRVRWQGAGCKRGSQQQ